MHKATLEELVSDNIVELDLDLQLELNVFPWLIGNGKMP